MVLLTSKKLKDQPEKWGLMSPCDRSSGREAILQRPDSISDAFDPGLSSAIRRQNAWRLVLKHSWACF